MKKLKRLLTKITEPSPRLIDPSQRHRARAMLIFVTTFWAIYFSIVVSTTIWNQFFVSTKTHQLVAWLGLIPYALYFYLAKTRYYTLSAIGMALTAQVGAFYVALHPEGQIHPNVLYYVCLGPLMTVMVLSQKILTGLFFLGILFISYFYTVDFYSAVDISMIMMHYFYFCTVILTSNFLWGRHLNFLKKAQEINTKLESQLAKERLKNQIAGQMEALTNLSAVGEMSATLAHEIATPLSIIKMAASRGVKKGADLNNESAIDSLQKVLAQANRLERISTNLRAVSRNSSQDPFKPTGVKEILSDLKELSADRALRHQVEIQWPKGDINNMINCREVEIVQVLINLLNNAFDATTQSTEKWIKIDVQEVNENIVFSVSDSGPGIPESIREEVLKPFFTTKEKGKGTGLGLSLCKRVIEEHGGTLSLDQCENTCFKITLPKVQTTTGKTAA